MMGPLWISIAATIGAVAYMIYKIVIGEREKRYQYLLIIPILLTIFSIFFSIQWFLFGEECTPQGHCFWTILERGSLEAIESVAGILGITNILFGWIYTERNKLTLGKSQLELIEYQFGKLYTVSVVTHFFATALCLLLTKAGAREGTFFSFLALSSGCVLQVLICLEIGLNPQNREKCSIALWEKESNAQKDYAAPVVITDMIRGLSNPDVYAHEGYRNVLFKKLSIWLGDFPEIRKPGQQNLEQMASDIRMISYLLHTLLDALPKSEQQRFIEDLFREVCKYLDAVASGCSQAELLCCGYIHCIYNINETDGTVEEMDRKMDILVSRIMCLTYYFQDKDSTYFYASRFLQRLLSGLEWYLFLTQKVRLPRYNICQVETIAHINDIFTALARSIFDLDNQVICVKNAQIAWNQV